MQQIVPKKRGRGRPRKNENMNNIIVPKKKTKKIKDEDDELILYLPIDMNDLKKYNMSDQTEDDTTTSLSSKKVNKIFTISDLQNLDTDSDVYEDYVEQKEFLKILKKRDKEINKLNNQIKELKELLTENDDYGTNLRKVYKMGFNFINSRDNKTLIDEKTDICCWWCTEHFTNPPCFIPERFSNNTYYVFGCFCSFNCASAYNIQMDDYKVWDRDSLLNKIYNMVSNSLDKIKIAPPRESLKKFGGILDINKFRNNGQRFNKEYRVIMQPMASLCPLLEETVNDTNKFKKLQLSKSNGLVLKRSTPLSKNKNNLLETINKIREKKL